MAARMLAPAVVSATNASWARAVRQRPATLLRVAAYGSTANGSGPTWQIRMLYDGDCPLCMKEVDFLRSRDAGKGNVDFVDIASPTYNPADNLGITFQQAMERIHAITADKKVVTDIEVFRRLYEAVGLGWVYAITANPIVERAANMVYGFWAKYRMEVTGREALSVILARRQQAAQQQGAISGTQCGDEDTACEIPLRGPTPAQPAVEFLDSECGDEDTACEIPLRGKQSPSQPVTVYQDNECGDEDTACEIPLRGKPTPARPEAAGSGCGDADTACEIPLVKK